jgi:hypothetical protein
MGTYEPQRRGIKYNRSTPTVVSQGNGAICWAAALECWLDIAVREKGEEKGTWSDDDAKRNHFDGLTWSRTKLDYVGMKGRWGDYMNPDDSLNPENMPKVALDIGMTGSVLMPWQIQERSLLERLMSKSCLYIIYFSVHMNHAIVAYGFDSTQNELSVMDPNPSQGLTTRNISFFKQQSRLNKAMFIGWTV